MVGLVKLFKECLQIHLVNDSFSLKLGMNQFLLAILFEDDLERTSAAGNKLSVDREAGVLLLEGILDQR